MRAGFARHQKKRVLPDQDDVNNLCLDNVLRAKMLKVVLLLNIKHVYILLSLCYAVLGLTPLIVRQETVGDTRTSTGGGWVHYSRHCSTLTSHGTLPFEAGMQYSTVGTRKRNDALACRVGQMRARADHNLPDPVSLAPNLASKVQIGTVMIELVPAAALVKNIPLHSEFSTCCFIVLTETCHDSWRTWL